MEKPKKVYRDSIQGIRSTNISRMIESAALADNGNVHSFFLKNKDYENDDQTEKPKKVYKDNVRISSLMFEEVRILIKENLEILLKDVILYLDLKQEKIVKENHVYPFLIHIPATLPQLKLCDSKGLKDKKDCFYFPETSFRKLIKEVGEDYRIGIKFSKEALQLIQYEIEKIVKKQLRNAVLEVIHAKRHTMFPKDLQLSKRISHDYSTKDYSYNDIDDIFSFDDFYGKMLKLLYPNNKNNLKMTSTYTEQLDFFINVMLHKLLKIASKVSKNNKLTTKEIKYSLYDLFPGELAKHAISEGIKSISSKKSKLVIDKDIIEEFVEDYYDDYDYDVKDVVFLTAVVEYLMAEIIELSIVTAEENKAFNSNSLYRAITNDTELDELRKRLKLDIIKI